LEFRFENGSVVTCRTCDTGGLRGSGGLGIAYSWERKLVLHSGILRISLDPSHEVHRTSKIAVDFGSVLRRNRGGLRDSLDQ